MTEAQNQADIQRAEAKLGFCRSQAAFELSIQLGRELYQHHRLHNLDYERGEKEMRAHAELMKRWLDDESMEIEMFSLSDKWVLVPAPHWNESALYREKPKEKKKVEKWLWAVSRNAKPGVVQKQEQVLTVYFYANTDFLRQDYPQNHWKIICRVEGSKIEVEE